MVEAGAPRLDRYLATLIPAMSRSQVQRLIETGHVLVNGAGARAADRLRPGDRLEWEVPAPEPSRLEPETIALTVVYEDADLLVIDKPAGLVVHPGPGHSRGTVVHALLGRGPGWSTIGGAERPGIVHRLDRDTSGLMVVARNDQTHRSLAQQLASRAMSRTYVAIVLGQVPDERARIEAAIGRDPRHRQRMAVHPSGRSAISEFRRLQLAPGHSLLEVTLLTGRTHQVRVHLAYVHHPVLGDPVYGRRSPIIGRPALHASRLAFRHPRTGEQGTFTSPPPDDFVRAWSAVGGTTIR
jgi:23S rRNA pseudouridine1911/1915/1917 synthase